MANGISQVLWRLTILFLTLVVRCLTIDGAIQISLSKIAYSLEISFSPITPFSSDGGMVMERRDCVKMHFFPPQTREIGEKNVMQAVCIGYQWVPDKGCNWDQIAFNYTRAKSQYSCNLFFPNFSALQRSATITWQELCEGCKWTLKLCFQHYHNFEWFLEKWSINED